MTGKEWLERVFAPAMRTGSPPTSELRFALRALLECGVLTEEEALQAITQIDGSLEAGRALQARGRELLRQRIGAPTSNAEPARERLEAILTPGRALADVDGVTIVVLAVELWTSKLWLRVAALRCAAECVYR